MGPPQYQTLLRPSVVVTTSQDRIIWSVFVLLLVFSQILHAMGLISVSEIWKQEPESVVSVCMCMNVSQSCRLTNKSAFLLLASKHCLTSTSAI